MTAQITYKDRTIAFVEFSEKWYFPQDQDLPVPDGQFATLAGAKAALDADEKKAATFDARDVLYETFADSVRVLRIGRLTSLNGVNYAKKPVGRVTFEKTDRFGKKKDNSFELASVFVHNDANLAIKTRLDNLRTQIVGLHREIDSEFKKLTPILPVLARKELAP